MTYHNFLDFIFTPISYFVKWLDIVANSLMSNYIVITLLGIVLFFSLIWLFFDTFRCFIRRHISKYEDFNDKYNDYVTYKKIENEYNSHRLDSVVNNVNNNLVPMSRKLKISNGYYYDYFNNVYLDSKDNTFYNFAKNDEVVSFIHNNFTIDSTDRNFLINKNDNSRVKRYVKSYDSNDNLLDLYNNVIVDSKDNTFYRYRD